MNNKNFTCLNDKYTYKKGVIKYVIQYIKQFECVLQN